MARYKLIACHVLWREICHFAAQSENVIEIQFLRQGLHETPDALRKELQSAIDIASRDATCDAILIGYGLCGMGIDGIVARGTRLVFMRGHDCITYLLGSKERYREHMEENPGTYWYSPGWIDTGGQPSKEKYETRYREYLEKFGKDNAAYLMETELGWAGRYNRAAYIDLVGGNNQRFREHTRACAASLGWSYIELVGYPRLMCNFLAGCWNPEDFLILEPGRKLAASHDDTIFKSIEA